MTTMKRIRDIILSILMIAAAVVVITQEVKVGCMIILAVMTLSLILYGIKQTVFYFTMARHMVSGQRILYEGIIMLNFGIFTATLSSIPTIYFTVYLSVYILIAGVVSLLGGLEAWKHKGKWLDRFILGVFCIIAAVVSFIFRNTPGVTVLVYVLGIIYIAISRIIAALKPSAIAYFQ